MPLRLSFRLMPETTSLHPENHGLAERMPPPSFSLQKYAGSFSPEFSVGVFHGGKQIGYVQAHVVSRHGKRDHIEMDRMFVLPEYRGKEVSDRFFDFLEYVARKNRMTLIHIPRAVGSVKKVVTRAGTRRFPLSEKNARFGKVREKDAFVRVRLRNRGR